MRPARSAGVLGIWLRNRKDSLRASAGPSLIPWRKGKLILDGPRTPERILSPPVSARVERSGSSAARISRAAIADRRYNTLRDTMPAGTPALPVAAGRSVYCYDPGGTPALPPSPGALPLHGSTTRPTQEPVEPRIKRVGAMDRHPQCGNRAEVARIPTARRTSSARRDRGPWTGTARRVLRAKGS